MTYEEFCARVKIRVQELKGEKAEVCIRKTLKNNGQELICLMIKEGSTDVIPTLYLEEFYRLYECGTCFEEVLEKILAVYEECQWQGQLDFSFFFDYQQVKNRIVYKLVNQKENEKLLEKIPWFPVLDLAMVFYYLLPEEMGVKANIPVDSTHLQMWNVQPEDLYEAAVSNTPGLLPFCIEPIRDVLVQLMEEAKENMGDTLLGELEDNISNLQEAKEVMYVLSNKEKLFGAACILYPEVLKNFSIKTGRDLLILPSSIHEVLLIPDDGGFDVEELKYLVRDVNCTQVEKEERLSDSIYYYSLKTGRVTLLQGEK